MKFRIQIKIYLNHPLSTFVSLEWECNEWYIRCVCPWSSLCYIPKLMNLFQIRYQLVMISVSIYLRKCTMSLIITSNFMSSNPAQIRCTQSNVMWSSLPVICDRSGVFAEHWTQRYNWNVVKHYNPNTWLLPLPLYTETTWSGGNSYSIFALDKVSHFQFKNIKIFG